MSISQKMTEAKARELARQYGFSEDGDPHGYILYLYNDAEHYDELWHMTRSRILWRWGEDDYGIMEGAFTLGNARHYSVDMSRLKLLPMAGGWKSSPDCGEQ